MQEPEPGPEQEPEPAAWKDFWVTSEYGQGTFKFSNGTKVEYLEKKLVTGPAFRVTSGSFYRLHGPAGGGWKSNGRLFYGDAEFE